MPAAAGPEDSEPGQAGPAPRTWAAGWARSRESTSLRVPRGGRPCAPTPLSQARDSGGGQEGPGPSPRHPAWSLSRHSSRDQSPGPLLPPAPQRQPRQDTSMRLTMLRQDSRLKPLVRRSLSARESSSSPGPPHPLPGQTGQGGMTPAAWPWRVKSSRVSGEQCFYRQK